MRINTHLLAPNSAMLKEVKKFLDLKSDADDNQNIKSSRLFLSQVLTFTVILLTDKPGQITIFLVEAISAQ